MNLKQLKKLIAQGESESTEFKKSTSLLKDAFTTVCAFLNGKGGYVFIGVSQEGKIAGQEVTDNTRQEIANHILKLEPPAQSQINIEYVPIENNKVVIAIEVSGGNHIPYTYDGRPYYRNQSTTSRMPQHRYEQLIVQRGQLNHSWEEQPAVGYSVDLLNIEEIQRTIERGIRKKRIPSDAMDENTDELLSNRFDLITKTGELKNAAIVLFAKKIKSPYLQCMIKMARFKGTKDLGEFIDNQRFYGNAFEILTTVDHFIMRHLPIASFFEEGKFERRDVPIIPALALREAFINAICHRDYSNRSASIYLSIFDDRLEIWNHGTLPKEIKIEDLKKSHKSYPRNELIAEVFYNRGLVEGWGKGTNRMLDLCREAGVPEPEFKEYSGGFEVTFKFREPMSSTVRVSDESKKFSQYQLSSRQESILEILNKSEELSTTEIIQNYPGALNQRTLQRELLLLQGQGRIFSVGKTRAKKWKKIKE